jgi:hypothetical protein
MDNRRLQLVVAGIIIVAAGLLIVIFVVPRTQAPGLGSGAAATGAAVPGAANGNRSAAAFPADIPIQASGTVTSAAGATPSGQFQAARSFVSAKTAIATFNFYKQLLTGSVAGWSVLAEINKPADPAHKAILARNGQGMLTINISAQPPSSSLVEMSFVGNPE